MFLLAVSVVSCLLVKTAFAKPVASDIILHEDEVLQVVFSYAADPQIAQSSPSLARNMEKEAQQEFREAFESLLSEIELPVAVEIVEPGKRGDKGLPVLAIHAVRWEITSHNEMEVVISAKLKGEGKQKNKLGSFRARDSVSGPQVAALQKQARIKVMRTALVELLGELNKHFPLPTNEAAEE